MKPCLFALVAIALAVPLGEAHGRPWLQAGRGTQRRVPLAIGDSARLSFTLQATDSVLFFLRYPAEITLIPASDTTYHEVVRGEPHGPGGVAKPAEDLERGRGSAGSAYLPSSPDSALSALAVGALVDDSGASVYPFLRAGHTGIGVWLEWCRVGADSSFVRAVYTDWLAPWRVPFDSTEVRVLTKSAPLRTLPGPARTKRTVR
jgi:hypothetical protein